MKRTLLLFSLFLCLAWQGAQAQGPFPVPVSAPNAARFIREQPSYAQYFVNGKSGSMTCTDQAALNAFLKFEVANQLPSTLMATAPAGSERPAKNTAGQSAPVTTGPAAVDANGATANGEDPMAVLDREIKTLEEQLSHLSPDADPPARDRYQQLLAERQRLQAKN